VQDEGAKEMSKAQKIVAIVILGAAYITCNQTYKRTMPPPPEAPKMVQIWSVSMSGARTVLFAAPLIWGDGRSDDTRGIEQSIEALKETGGMILIPRDRNIVVNKPISLNTKAGRIGLSVP